MNVIKTSMQKPPMSEQPDVFEVLREVNRIKDVLAEYGLFVGDDNPEGNLRGKLGSILMRNNGGDGTSAYLKESDDMGVTGWSPIATRVYRGLKVPGAFRNAKVSYDSSLGRLTISGWDGDWSTENPGIFTVPDGSGGWTELEFTENVTFDDMNAADSDFLPGGGMPFHATAGTAWGNDLPIMFYATTDGSRHVIGFSLDPTMTETPASSLIGYKDTPPSTDGQTNFIIMDENITVANYAEVPCWRIGSCRLDSMDTNNDWAFAALDKHDGAGHFYNFGSRSYSRPAGQLGSGSGSLFMANSGTPPIYTAFQAMNFKLDRSGICHASLLCQNVSGGTAGSGAGTLEAPLPYQGSGDVADLGWLNYYGGYAQEGSALDQFAWCGIDANGNSRLQWYINTTIPTAQRALLLNDQSNTARAIAGNLIYRAFGG